MDGMAAPRKLSSSFSFVFLSSQRMAHPKKVSLNIHEFNEHVPRITKPNEKQQVIVFGTYARVSPFSLISEANVIR